MDGGSRYLSDGVYRGMVAAMLDARAHALSGLAFYLEDASYSAAGVMDYSNADLHRECATHPRTRTRTHTHTPPRDA